MKAYQWVIEVQTITCLLVLRISQQAQTASPTVPAQAAPSDPTALPSLLGLPIGMWVAILGVGGGGAILGNSALSVLKTGVGAIQTFGEDLPVRLKAEREREGVETLNLKEEVRFAQIINEALKDSRQQIVDLQGNITQMQANDIQRSGLFTQMQQAMLDQGVAHRKEIQEIQTAHRSDMEALSHRIDDMQQKNDLQEESLREKRNEIDHWKELYNTEHARAERLLQEKLKLEEQLRQFQTGEVAVVKIEPAAASSVILPEPAPVPDESDVPELPEPPPSSSSLPGLPNS